jgi:cyclopropane fatty-acyl-phospholipid synthase-like methyltransferase
VAVVARGLSAPFGIFYGDLMSNNYVHGYDSRENRRLQDQASTLVELLHLDTTYPEGSSVLEAGCGVGAQTVTLASNSPGALITSVDVSEASVGEARKAVQAAGINNVTLQQAIVMSCWKS